MPSGTNRRRRGTEKDRFRVARRERERTVQRIRGRQLLFPWFLEGPATDQTGRAAT